MTLNYLKAGLSKMSIIRFDSFSLSHVTFVLKNYI
jgi:hypothetical protein